MQDFFNSAAGAFIGAGLAFLADGFWRSRDSRVREWGALNGLIIDLAGRRAFAVADTWEWRPGEVERVVGSVNSVRSAIREAKSQTRPQSPAEPVLARMTRAANTFIELSETRPDHELVEALKDLTSALTECQEELYRLKPRKLNPAAPGSQAL